MIASATSSSVRKLSMRCRALLHAACGEVPARTGGPAILRLHPLLTQRFLLGMLCDDIRVQPFCHLRAGGGASQLVEFVSGERRGLDDERGQELRFDVAGIP